MYALKMDVLEMQHSFGSHCETAACSPSICSTETETETAMKRATEREQQRMRKNNRVIERQRATERKGKKERAVDKQSGREGGGEDAVRRQAPEKHHRQPAVEQALVCQYCGAGTGLVEARCLVPLRQTHCMEGWSVDWQLPAFKRISH